MADAVFVLESFVDGQWVHEREIHVTPGEFIAIGDQSKAEWPDADFVHMVAFVNNSSHRLRMIGSVDR